MPLAGADEQPATPIGDPLFKIEINNNSDPKTDKKHLSFAG